MKNAPPRERHCSGGGASNADTHFRLKILELGAEVGGPIDTSDGL